MKYYLVILVLEGSTFSEAFSAEYLVGIYTSEEDANKATQSAQMKQTIRLAIADMGIDGYEDEYIDHHFVVMGYDFTKDNAFRMSFDHWDL